MDKIYKFQKGKQEELIQKAIIKAGSQRKLAHIVGIPKGSISSYKAEKLLIPQNRLRIVLDYLKLDIKDIEANVLDVKDHNWGQKLGGRKSIEQYTENQLQERLKWVRSHKVYKVRKLTVPLSSEVCELYGILLGDGCISLFTDRNGTDIIDISITGDARLETEYYDYIKTLLKDYFKVSCYIYARENTLRLHIRNRGLAWYLADLGFPIGKKYEHIAIPESIVKNGWNYVKHVIRGIFDTDGSIYAKKNENYRFLHVSISTKSETFRTELHQILKKQGYPAYINGSNLVLRGNSNVTRWMSDIGSSNPKHKLKYSYWVRNGSLPSGLGLVVHW